MFSQGAFLKKKIRQQTPQSLSGVYAKMFLFFLQIHDRKHCRRNSSRPCVLQYYEMGTKILLAGMCCLIFDQVPQTNLFSLRMCSSQVYVYVFSPDCTFRCRTKVHFSANLLPQIVHTKFFSLVCTFKCATDWYFPVNFQSQTKRLVD